MARRSKILALAALSAVIALGAAASAEARIYRLSGVQLSDGTTVSGSFSTNISGFPSGHDITTTDGAIGGYHYDNAINVSYNPGDTAITFYHASPAYDGYLTLAFAQPIGARGQTLLAGIGGPSLECDTYGCAGVSAHDRYVVSGAMLVPEPGAWAMIAVGMAAVGLALRRRNRGCMA